MSNNNDSKFCGICQTAFARDKDNYRSEYCFECHNTEKTVRATYWKSTFALKRANTLSTEQEKLAEKLKDNRSLVEGVRLARVSESDGAYRSLPEIRKEQTNHVANFDVVRRQVAELLPGVLGELGLSGKVNAELLIDAIVPVKIGVPLNDVANGRSALRSIVLETVTGLDMGRAIQKEASIRPHGIVQTINGGTILDEGIHRVTSNYGSSVRTITANPMMMQEALPEAPLEAAPAPPLGAPLGAAAPPNPMGMPPGNGMPSDSAASQDPYAPPVEPSAENEAQVVHLPDEQAQQIISDKSADGQAPMAGPGMPPGPSQPPPGMMDEGIGTYSGNENAQPDAASMEEMPHEGINRIQSSVSDLVSRKIVANNTKLKKPSDASLFSFAGKLSNYAPCQIVRLESKDLHVIATHPPINYMTASYSDGSAKTFKFYATDKGYLFISDDFSVHATDEKRFAQFIESDSSFSKWAFLPPTVNPEDGPMAQEHSIDEMSLPEVPPVNHAMAPEAPVGGLESPAMAPQSGPVGEGDPGFNEIQQTDLNSSPNHQIPGGLAADQDAIFNNSHPGTVDGAPTPENELLDTATDLMPEVEHMYPHESPEHQQDLAISAAIYYLEAKYASKKKLNKAAFGPSFNGKPSDTGTNIINNMGPKLMGGIDTGLGKLPGMASGLATKLQAHPNSAVQNLGDEVSKLAPHVQNFSNKARGAAGVIGRGIGLTPQQYPRLKPGDAQFQDEINGGTQSPKDLNRFVVKQPNATATASLSQKSQEIIQLTADMSFDDFVLSTATLLELGYNENDILMAYAACEKSKLILAEDDGDINGSTGAVEAVAKTFGDTSEASRRGLRDRQANRLNQAYPGGGDFDTHPLVEPQEILNGNKGSGINNLSCSNCKTPGSTSRPDMPCLNCQYGTNGKRASAKQLLREAFGPLPSIMDTQPSNGNSERETNNYDDSDKYTQMVKSLGPLSTNKFNPGMLPRPSKGYAPDAYATQGETPDISQDHFTLQQNLKPSKAKQLLIEAIRLQDAEPEYGDSGYEESPDEIFVDTTKPQPRRPSNELKATKMLEALYKGTYGRIPSPDSDEYNYHAGSDEEGQGPDAASFKHMLSTPEGKDMFESGQPMGEWDH